MQRFGGVIDDAFAAVDARAGAMSMAELADALLALVGKLRGEMPAIVSLLGRAVRLVGEAFRIQERRAHAHRADFGAVQPASRRRIGRRHRDRPAKRNEDDGADDAGVRRRDQSGRDDRTAGDDATLFGKQAREAAMIDWRPAAAARTKLHFPSREPHGQPKRR
jgi:hypothetical protein